MWERRLDKRTRFVRQCRLGSEAVYEIVEVSGDIVTADVVSAPGLEAGQRVRLMAKAVRAMERVELPELASARLAGPFRPVVSSR
jgi:hypothetical protein